MNFKTIAATAVFALCASAQSDPSFEVASIKVNSSADHRTSIQMAPGGRFIATGVTVNFLIQRAYDIKGFQVTGAPSWINTERWDISAKAEGAVDQEKIKPYLRSLLAERFKMTVHQETREQPIYALVVGKNGPKVQAAKEEPDNIEGADPHSGTPGVTRRGSTIQMGRGELTLQKAPIAMFAEQLSNLLSRGVTDQTGLAGRYDFKLTWTPDESQMQMRGPGDAAEGAAPPSDSGPSIFTAVQEQLGLKLESAKGPVRIYVLDRIEKPTEN
jgi:bla regulator protein blaR1